MEDYGKLLLLYILPPLQECSGRADWITIERFASHSQRRKSACMCAKSLQSCPTLCDFMNCSNLPGSSVHEILQARILEWRASFQVLVSVFLVHEQSLWCVQNKLITTLVIHWFYFCYLWTFDKVKEASLHRQRFHYLWIHLYDIWEQAKL